MDINKSIQFQPKKEDLEKLNEIIKSLQLQVNDYDAQFKTQHSNYKKLEQDYNSYKYSVELEKNKLDQHTSYLNDYIETLTTEKNKSSIILKEKDKCKEKIIY